MGHSTACRNNPSIKRLSVVVTQYQNGKSLRDGYMPIMTQLLIPCPLLRIKDVYLYDEGTDISAFTGGLPVI